MRKLDENGLTKYIDIAPGKFQAKNKMNRNIHSFQFIIICHFMFAIFHFRFVLYCLIAGGRAAVEVVSPVDGYFHA